MGKGGKGKGGSGAWVWVPDKKPSHSKGNSKGKGKSKGKGRGNGKKRTDSHPDEDPKGSCRVFVMGFDFGTTDEQFEGHMKKAGPIHTVHWVSKAKAIVVYKNKSSKAKAAALNETTIPGNERYITVVTGDD